MSPREDNPNYPGVDGLWFKVTDKDGNDVDLTPYSPKPVKMKYGKPAQIIVDDNDTHLGWYPIYPLTTGTGITGTVKQFKFILLMLAMGMKNWPDYTVTDDNSPGPLDDDAQMNYNSVGLTRNEPLALGETPPDKTDDNKDKNDNKKPTPGDDNDKGTTDGNKKTGDDDKGKRDYHPRRPSVKGFWFEVVDINGNSLDLSNDFQYWDKAHSRTDLAWLPITGIYKALQLKKRVLKKLGLKISKYSVYKNDDESNPYNNSSDVDLNHYGLKRGKPLVFRENQDDDSYESNGSDDSSGDSDEEMPPPDNPDYISNTSEDYSNDDVNDMPPPDNPDYISNTSQDYSNDDVNDMPPPDNPVYVSNTLQDDNNNDPYRFFTKRIQCMSNADWSRYEGSIQNTYQGEILWTDGNLSYGVANMMAYMAVRRVPNTPTGSVVAVGRAANEPAYFVYLG